MKRLVAGGLISLVISGCATTGFFTKNGRGFISDFTEGSTATEHNDSSKIGEACSKNIMGIYSSGDASIEAAKRHGNITKVATVDYKIFSVGPFYGSVCTVVRGS